MPGGASASYSYDADGRRVKQVSGATTSNYLWDEASAYGDVVLETDGSGAIQTSYVLGNGELLSQKKGTSAPSYFLMDGQGSVRNLTDSNGTLISGQSYSYDAFGKLLSGQTSPASNYLYTGQQFDPLSGLYSLRARYYNPGDGRFLNQDRASVSLQQPNELNRYSYVANNPVNNFDPSGYNSEELSLSYNAARNESDNAARSRQGNSNGGLSEVYVSIARILAYEFAKLAVNAISELLYYDLGADANGSPMWQDNHFKRLTTATIGVVMDRRTGELHVGLAFTKYRYVDGLNNSSAAASLLPGNVHLIRPQDSRPDPLYPFETNNHAEDIFARWAIQNFPENLVAVDPVNHTAQVTHPYTVLAMASNVHMCEPSMHYGITSCTSLFGDSPVSYRLFYPHLFGETITDDISSYFLP
jgi:RHS repeat-associated protein